MPRSVLRFFAEYVVGRFRSVFLLLWAVQKKKRPKINNSSVFRFRFLWATEKPTRTKYFRSGKNDQTEWRNRVSVLSSQSRLYLVAAVPILLFSASLFYGGLLCYGMRISPWDTSLSRGERGERFDCNSWRIKTHRIRRCRCRWRWRREFKLAFFFYIIFRLNRNTSRLRINLPGSFSRWNEQPPTLCSVINAWCFRLNSGEGYAVLSTRRHQGSFILERQAPGGCGYKNTTQSSYTAKRSTIRRLDNGPPWVARSRWFLRFILLVDDTITCCSNSVSSSCHPSPRTFIRMLSLKIINTSYRKLPFGSGDYPDKLLFHQALN